MLCIFISGLMPAIILKDNILLENQNERQKYILQSDVNFLLYDYFEKEGGLEPIFTNYPLRFLPGFEDLQINIGGFEDYDFYNQTRKKYPEVRYMLISLFKDNGEVVNEIYEGAEQGLYEIIFKQDKYLFVKILQN